MCQRLPVLTELLRRGELPLEYLRFISDLCSRGQEDIIASELGLSCRGFNADLTTNISRGSGTTLRKRKKESM